MIYLLCTAGNYGVTCHLIIFVLGYVRFCAWKESNDVNYAI